MKLLRDKSQATKILILYELYTKSYAKLTPIADKIGVTQQAISEYMKQLITTGLVRKRDGEYKPTIQGVYLLQQELTDLKQFVDDRLDQLLLIKHCVALAQSTIHTGEKVGLFMKDGWLVADTKPPSSSVGIANNDAEPGEYITLSNLEGILDHTLGKLWFFSLPSPFLTKKTSIDLSSIKKRIQSINIEKVGIVDVVAKSFCQRLGLSPDFEYGVIYAAIDAGQRGINTALFGYDDTIKEAITIFEEFNEKSSEKLQYEIISLK